MREVLLLSRPHHEQVGAGADLPAKNGVGAKRLEVEIRIVERERGCRAVSIGISRVAGLVAERRSANAAALDLALECRASAA
jgi:hypothetical protein